MTQASHSEPYDLLIVDSRHLLWRSASVLLDLKAEVDGQIILTGGIYGFLKILLSTWRRFGGQVIATWDRHDGPTERRKMYAAYKNKAAPEPGTAAAKRDVERRWMIDSMKHQEDAVKRILTLLGCSQASSPGWEADDTIATLSNRFGSNRIGILSGDRDLLQLVTDNVNVIRPVPQGSFEVCTPELVQQQFGFSPAQILDYKALAGDAGDNIPGARGIGEKTATKLLQEHGTWESCLTWASAAQKPNSTQTKLIASLDNVRLSAKLAMVNRKAPLEFVQGERNTKAVFIEIAKLKLNSLMADGRMQEMLEMGA